jgi:hypothetical protein
LASRCVAFGIVHWKIFVGVETRERELVHLDGHGFRRFLSQHRPDPEPHQRQTDHSDTDEGSRPPLPGCIVFCLLDRLGSLARIRRSVLSRNLDQTVGADPSVDQDV